MVYVIFNTSHEYDDMFSEPSVVYVSTNKEDAINHFHYYYDEYKTMTNSKWNYSASLYEFEDGWTKFSKKESNVLLSVDSDE